ncbi:MAG: gliding motility-associated C-terminal domain-containing protein [Bacteroidales bacterium]|jgi:gliding motility-associated-like protein|nr:gliding motility-associated C-terminal domain-containing protein [Bacteroidales bacterium]
MIRKYSATLLLLIMTISCFAETLSKNPPVKETQPCSISAGNDTTIRISQGSITISLNAPDGALSYNWTSSNGSFIAEPDSAHTYAIISETTSFYLTANYVDSTNLVYNGDFELGNVGFTSALNHYEDGDNHFGAYIIADSSIDFFPASPSVSCEGDGLFMCIDGARSPTYIYLSTVNVEPNTDYMFSVQSTNFNHASSFVPNSQLSILQFSVNNVAIGNNFVNSNYSCDWKTFFEIWNSGTNSNAAIRILNNNTAASGNDFAIDNVMFRKVCNATDTITFYIIHPCNWDVELPNDITICKGDSIKLYNMKRDSCNYQWQYTDEYGNSQYAFNDTLSVPIYASQRISLLLNKGNGCDTMLYVNVFVDELPPISITGNKIVCYGDSTTLTANVAYGDCIFVWNDSDTASTITIRPTADTTLNVTAITPYGCKTTSQTTVSIQSPRATLPNDIIICQGDTTILPVIGIANRYEWSSVPYDSTLTLLNDSTISVSPNQDTRYNVRAIINDSCFDEDDVMVRVEEIPVARISYSPLSIDQENPIVEFEDSSLYGTNSLWEISDGTTYSQPAFSHTFDINNDEYNVSLISSTANGCADTASITLNVMSNHYIFAPNAVCPTEKNPLNAAFRVFITGTSEFELTIYNRYGQVVWRTNDKNAAWDCKYNNLYVPSGTYVWRAIYSFEDSPGAQQQKTSSFVVYY